MSAGDRPGRDGTTTLSNAEIRSVLRHGTIEVAGRVGDASNLTLLGMVEHNGTALNCVYKPVRGERPLWDFPDGTLADREVLAHEVSLVAGWNCVPPTVGRPGPLGAGMVQQWIGPVPPGAGPMTSSADADRNAELDSEFDSGSELDDDDSEDTDEYVEVDEELVTILPARDVTAGWLPVFRAVDPSGEMLAVCHADDPRLALIAGFDIVINNADRKAPHLVRQGGRVLGIDHGLAFHTDDKLRTILWGWAGEVLPEEVQVGLQRIADWLERGWDGGAEDDVIHPETMLTLSEHRALTARVDHLLADPRFPQPPEHRSPIPWPPL